ncbi:hypothetical protein Tco_0631656 [Tanacetum coccineum]
MPPTSLTWISRHLTTLTRYCSQPPGFRRSAAPPDPMPFALSKILSLLTSYNASGMFLSQQKYATEFLIRAVVNMHYCKTCRNTVVIWTLNFLQSVSLCMYLRASSSVLSEASYVCAWQLVLWNYSFIPSTVLYGSTQSRPRYRMPDISPNVYLRHLFD